jgi:hypothetical protein
MFNSKIKNFPLFNLIDEEKSWMANGLKILTAIAILAAGGLAGYAVNGVLGSTFGLMLGYVTGKITLL